VERDVCSEGRVYSSHDFLDSYQREFMLETIAFSIALFVSLEHFLHEMMWVESDLVGAVFVVLVNEAEQHSENVELEKSIATLKSARTDRGSRSKAGKSADG
jgi:hypothetical protein